jgi:hypothetical protein
MCAPTDGYGLDAGRGGLRELAERDGITRRYVRRLVYLTFLCPELVEAILQGRQPVELTATRLSAGGRGTRTLGPSPLFEHRPG